MRGTGSSICAPPALCSAAPAAPHSSPRKVSSSSQPGLGGQSGDGAAGSGERGLCARLQVISPRLLPCVLSSPFSFPFPDLGALSPSTRLSLSPPAHFPPLLVRGRGWLRSREGGGTAEGSLPLTLQLRAPSQTCCAGALEPALRKATSAKLAQLEKGNRGVSPTSCLAKGALCKREQFRCGDSALEPLGYPGTVGNWEAEDCQTHDMYCRQALDGRGPAS